MERQVAASSSLFFTELVVIAAVIFGFFAVANAATDPNDVQGLQVLYTSLNSPSQLTSWKASGGDPCGESWKGVTCQGSSVVSVQISGLGLSGTMGYLLNNLGSLKTLNLASNNLSGNLPYSISNMGSLNYLNISRNMLSQTVGDMFANHSALDTLDVSFNNFTGIPIFLRIFDKSFNSSSTKQSAHRFFERPSWFALTNLNVANNHFTGWIPQELTSIPNFVYDGNAFANGPAPPPPPYTSPPPGRPRNHSRQTPPGGHKPDSNRSNSQNENKNGGNKKEIAARPSTGSLPVSSEKGSATKSSLNMEMQEQRSKPTASVSDLKPPPADNLTVEKTATNSFSQENLIVKVLLVVFIEQNSPMGSVQMRSCLIQIEGYLLLAVDDMPDLCFALMLTTPNNENLAAKMLSLWIGNIFCVVSISRMKSFICMFCWVQIMAIKKVDSAALSLQEEDNFLEAISNMSRLRHPNIVALAGYCVEHGQRLLVHDYIGNGSLHDMLHFADERSKMLTWNARVRVALGTARALENLKSANILLDEELNPHLSDCGLAALGQIQNDSDVYSFGVVMLELLTGRKPLDSSRARSEQSLVRWATPQLHDIDALAKMVDPALNGMYPAKSLSRFADVIALCVQPEPEFRPPMSEVVQALVRLMQRASIVKRRSSEESGFAFKTPDHEPSDML
ncbi:UNVERIFIED_CONTAM: protein STRUBBELIG-RECEPTOR FAMILY 8 [Sesamum calycinum]|uniref:Protein STRUBBELIG-RECEPTOR FAMILY 8 n=1 Tax=Sesamum calycinum TaxID=2727403 RepID=A0AAW2MCH0_9LAMI